jgi:hypothetical protein
MTVAKASSKIACARFGREGWTLEPPAVLALLDKIKARVFQHRIGISPERGAKY